jgi:predicted nucleotide-binding protein (sugar kinase/HSP70/actin superfamily)
MKITFPHLGNACFGAKALFEGLGIEYVMPPLTNRKTLEIGSCHSPEEMCLPFKIMVGNYIQSIERGADTIIITGSCGPCRFGEYCELQINLLKKMGYNLEFIVIDQPGGIGIKEFFRRINKISSASSKPSFLKTKALLDAFKIIGLVDKLDEDAHYKAGFEKNKGQCKKLLNSCKAELLKCKDTKEMLKLISNCRQSIKQIPVDKEKKPIKIAIIGEIYTIIEPFSNLNIEDKLMDYGVSSKRTLTPSWWLKDTLMSPLKLDSLDIKRAGKDYLGLCIGGYAQECIGEAMLSKEQGFDGAIQILPMGCMPEIVSKSILPSISRNENFPIMSLVLDEMTGEAGFVTRIEAFIDLLERRRDNNVLFGS